MNPKRWILVGILLVGLLVGTASADQVTLWINNNSHVGENTDAAWLTIRNDTGDSITWPLSTSWRSGLTLSATAPNTQSYHYRGFGSFGYNASMPNGSTVTSAELHIAFLANNTAQGPVTNFSLIDYNGPNLAIGTSYANTTFTRQAADTKVLDVSGYTTISLTNLTQINTTGYNTTYLFTNSADASGIDLTWTAGSLSTGMSSKPLELSGGASKAYIIVDYDPPVVAGAPLSVTGLTNETITSCGFINWTWTNPTANFDVVRVYKNDTFLHNVSTPYDNWTTDITKGLTYKISTSTCSPTGECNATLVESTIQPCGVDYYAYGDSITEAAPQGDLGVSGDAVYLYQMLGTHNTTATKGHNMDGSGWESSGGLTNWATHPGSPFPTNVFVMFGMNDKHTGTPVTTTEVNLKDIYDNYTAVGSNTTVLIETLAEDGQGDWSTYTNQSARITALQNYFDGEGIPYVKIYDAIDSTPRNGIPDEVNMSNMADSRHPNTEAHRLMGEYLWDYLNGDPLTDIPVAAFTCTPLSGSTLTTVSITCTDASTNFPTDRIWYNNTTQISTDTNPTFNLGVGLHDIKLNATNGAGSDWENKTGYINITLVIPPVADFVAGTISGPTPLSPSFTDLSTNTPTSWSWKYSRDGGAWTEFSTDQTPLGTFTTAGVYSINLTATNIAGNDEEYKANYLNVTNATPAAASPYNTGPPAWLYGAIAIGGLLPMIFGVGLITGFLGSPRPDSAQMVTGVTAIVVGTMVLGIVILFMTVLAGALGA